MAGQSAKKQVANNIAILQRTHIASGAVYALSLIARFLLKRPEGNKMFIFTAIPLLISQYVIEKTGRPVLDPRNNKIVSEGQDLAQEGLTEYLFDIIYVTLGLNVLSVLLGTNLVWWLYLAVPAFAGYKAYGLLQAGRAMLGGGPQSSQQQQQQQQQQEKSKRQLKREARGDKPKMRYR